MSPRGPEGVSSIHATFETSMGVRPVYRPPPQWHPKRTLWLVTNTLTFLNEHYKSRLGWGVSKDTIGSTMRPPVCATSGCQTCRQPLQSKVAVGKQQDCVEPSDLGVLSSSIQKFRINQTEPRILSDNHRFAQSLHTRLGWPCDLVTA